MSGESREVVVLGGGISGLTVGCALRKAGVDVCLLEKEEQVGGCTRTERREGFLLEKGPFNVIVRDASFEALLEEVAGDGGVVSAGQDARLRYIYRHRRLHAVATNPAAMLTSRMLPLSARMRMLRGLVLSRRAGATEETIEQAASRRIGREATETLVSAAISGIFSGDIGRLSLSACFPTAAAVDRRVRSLIGYGLCRPFTRKKNKRRPPRWRGMVSLDGGLGSMTRAMGATLGPDCLTGVRVRSLYHDTGGYTIVYDRDVEAHALHAQRIVLAVPVGEAARLLGGIVPPAAALLSPIESTSVAVVNLGYRRGDVGHSLRGFGFLVPRNEPSFPLMGVLWADSVFPHHAPPDQHLLRVFIGGARDPNALERSDDRLVESARRGLRDVLGVRGEPTLVDVARHAPAIPQYALGHCERIARIRAALQGHPGLFVAGNYLEGVSLNDCVRVGSACAATVLADIRERATAADARRGPPCRAL